MSAPALPLVNPMTVLAEAFTEHHDRLLGYIADRLPIDLWHRAEDLAQETWLEALEHAHLDVAGIEPESALPIWLACRARVVIRRHVSPVPAGRTDWALLTQQLGHSDTWPAHWHDALAAEGQAALLELASLELAADSSPVSAPASSLAIAA